MIKRRENTQIYGVPTFMCTFKLLFHETCNGGLGILCFVNYHLFPQILHSKFYFYNFLLDKSCQVLVHLRHLYLGSQNTFHVIKPKASKSCSLCFWYCWHLYIELCMKYSKILSSKSWRMSIQIYIYFETIIYICK
jgi:hypothetical protein